MNDKIKCPNCSHKFDVEEALSGQLEAQFKAEYEKKIAEQAKRFQEEKLKLDQQKAQLESQQEKQEERLQQALAKQLKLAEGKAEKQKEILEAALAKQVKAAQQKAQKSALEAVEIEMKALQDENEKRKSENKSLKQKEVNLLKKEADLKEKAEDLNLQMEKEMLERKREIEEKARAKEREVFELQKLEFNKKFEDQKRLIEEMKRKAEQGSMQLQGEVQELALEALLASLYPFDTIAEVKKGARGADCIQTVVNSAQQSCGSIVYESKRTKNFAKDWIDKLKQDQVSCKAEIAVLVTQTMPSDMQRFGERNGVWICGFNEVKSLSFVLRQMLIKTQSIKQSQENKGDKMELLYTYLTGEEFKQNVKRISENYDNMLTQLNAEKKAMTKIWATREKQMWVVQENIASLFGSIEGIAGNTLGTATILELPEAD